MKKSVKRSLGIMLETNEEMASRIVEFFDRIPEKVKEKINFLEPEGEYHIKGESWVFSNSGDTLCISFGDARNSVKDYMNIAIYGKSKEQLDMELRKIDEVLLGYVTFFLYNAEKKGKPTQLCYNFILSKERMYKNRYNIELRLRTNTKLKEMAELIELNGFANMVREISDHGTYTVTDLEVNEKQKGIMQ